MAIAKVATALQEKTELVKRRSGSTGSSARVSTDEGDEGDEADREQVQNRGRGPRMSHAAPHEVASSEVVRPMVSRTIPATSTLASRRWVRQVEVADDEEEGGEADGKGYEEGPASPSGR